MIYKARQRAASSNENFNAPIAGLIIIFSLALAGCSKTNYKEFKIGNVEFRVPSEFVEDQSIPWLPSSQNQGFRFTLNPRSKLQEQILVRVADRTSTCSNTFDGKRNIFSQGCLPSNENQPETLTKSERYQKIYEDKSDRSRWHYEKLGVNNERLVFAACYALDNDKDGLCTSARRYNDVIYSLTFRDAEIKKLNDICTRIEHHLASWINKDQ